MECFATLGGFISRGYTLQALITKLPYISVRDKQKFAEENCRFTHKHQLVKKTKRID